MMMRAVLISIVAAAGVAAQQPQISNTNLQTASAASGLDAALQSQISRQSGAAWFGYAVPKIPGEQQSCCWNDGGKGCGLEGQRNTAAPAPPVPVKLEGPSHVAVLFRAEQGVVGKIRTFTMDCPLDAGGLPVHWLTDVRP